MEQKGILYCVCYSNSKIQTKEIDESIQRYIKNEHIGKLLIEGHNNTFSLFTYEPNEHCAILEYIHRIQNIEDMVYINPELLKYIEDYNF